jgi:hypothetical protein
VRPRAAGARAPARVTRGETPPQGGARPRAAPPPRRAPPAPPRRTYRLRTYRKCFPGAEGARWLVSGGHAPDEAGAVALGNAMLQAGLVHHVAFEHTFKNNDLLYK